MIFPTPLNQRLQGLKWRYALYHACGETSVIYAIWFVLLTTYGGGSGHAAEVVFGLALLLGGLADPTTGPLADRYGRRRLLITAAILNMLGGTLLLSNLSFVLVGVGFVLMVVAEGCVSGSYEALTVDNLRAWQASDQATTTTRLFSLAHSLHFAVRGIVGISAGLLFEISPYLPLGIIIIFSTIRLLTALLEYEEPFQRSSRSIIPQLVEVFRLVWSNKLIRGIFALYLLTILSSTIPWTTFQPVLTKQGVSPGILSVTFGSLSLMGAAGSFLVNRFPQLNSSVRFLILGLGISFLSGLGLILFPPYIAIGTILLAGFFWPSFHLRYVNKLAHAAPESTRASLLSLLSTLEWIASGLVSIFIAEKIVALVP